MTDQKEAERKRTPTDFEFDDEIGRGSYSSVVKVTEKSNGRVFAAKILDKRHIIKENKVKYVNIEKEILNRLNHPFVIRLWYTFQDATGLYKDFILDYAENGELFDLIRKHGSLNFKSTVFYSAEILSAVEYLHQNNIIHRDLKPENILLDQKMHIKITDFGTAKGLTADDDKAGSFVGTAEYVAPELLLPEYKYTTKSSDIWALGCIIYQMLSGKPPFKGGHEYMTFQKVQNLEYTLPDYFEKVAQEIIQDILVINPDKRIGAHQSNYNCIKEKKFFEGIDFDSLSTTEVPTLGPNEKVPKIDETEEKPHFPYEKFLINNEKVLHSGIVYKKKGLFSRKRLLVLTGNNTKIPSSYSDKPRIFYIDQEKNELKGEIEFNSKLIADKKNDRNFFIHTPNRTYYLEDKQSQAGIWIEKIRQILSKGIMK